MDKIIPVGQFLPYTLEDLSVVIPQASQYVKRIKWFLPQYIKGTPKEVVKNTVVVYDPLDEETKAVLAQYGIKGLTATPPHSTYKMEAGFKSVKTRLCVRMHNDAFIKRSDWAQSLVDYFNQETSSQLVGAFNISGGIAREILDKILIWYPNFKTIYDNLDFSNSQGLSVGAPFFSAIFMAGQTYVMRDVYSLVVELNKGDMNKEDVLFTILTSFLNIKLTNWTNLYNFVANIGARYGDFEEGFIPPDEQFMVTEENRANFPKAEFKEVVYG